jgi:hypothetical protein
MAYGAWSVGIEYSFVDLGRNTLSLAPVPGVPGSTTYFTGTSTAAFFDRENIVRVKLSYHFNGIPFVAGRCRDGFRAPDDNNLGALPRGHPLKR